MDMRFYWIKDRVGQGQYKVKWMKGNINLADYFTKHHPPSHHIRMRPTYLHTAHTTQDTECKGVLIRNSDLSACTTAIPTSLDPDPIQSPISITIEFETDTTKSGGWTLVARRARP